MSGPTDFHYGTMSWPDRTAQFHGLCPPTPPFLGKTKVQSVNAVPPHCGHEDDVQLDLGTGRRRVKLHVPTALNWDRSRDSSVGIATRLRAERLDDQGSIPGGGWEFFSLCCMVAKLGL
jgi:hypothetical protein